MLRPGPPRHGRFLTPLTPRGRAPRSQVVPQMKPTSNQENQSGFEMAGRAFHLVCSTPLPVLAAYFIGTVPFVLGLLYFWADMSRSAFAARRCFDASFGLAALFLWMKCWQSVFAAGLRAGLTRTPPPAWTAGRLLRLALKQTALQPYGLFLIPAAMVVMFPFYAAHAFYQNLTVMDDGREESIKDLARRAWKQSLIWPRQNHVLIWLLSPWVLASGLLAAYTLGWIVVSAESDLQVKSGLVWAYLLLNVVLLAIYPLSPFGCAVAGNIAAGLILLPELAKFLFGIESVFTLGGDYSILNTTFLVTVFGLSYLCLDPFLKAAHALRCFYGESLQTGEDLLTELRTFTKGNAP